MSAAARAAPVHLVTVLYNSGDCVAAFAGSLARQGFRDWHLIAVDNASAGSSAGSSEVLSGAVGDRVSIIRNPVNVGFARAANQGMRAALGRGAEFVVLINNDTLIPADFLERFLAARHALRADVIVPRIMRLDRPEAAWYAGGHLECGWIFRTIHEPHDAADTRAVRRVEFASGCCLGLSRDVLARVGLFDESFFVYWEDADFCLRLKQHGIPIYYVSDISILHAGGQASGGEFGVRFNRLYYRSYIQVVRKHFGTAATLRTVMRVALKELGRRDKDWRRLAAMLMAMAGGLTARLVPPARI
jgi:GT2 family glycosyltransferase